MNPVQKKLVFRACFSGVGHDTVPTVGIDGCRFLHGSACGGRIREKKDAVNGYLKCLKESVQELKDNEGQFATEYRRARFEKK